MYNTGKMESIFFVMLKIKLSLTEGTAITVSSEKQVKWYEYDEQMYDRKSDHSMGIGPKFILAHVVVYRGAGICKYFDLQKTEKGNFYQT